MVRRRQQFTAPDPSHDRLCSTRPGPGQPAILLSIMSTTGTTLFHLAGKDTHIHPGSSEEVTHN